ncbi:hypothetical protein GALMADRAFT_137857 [Galerina marginata CBS 339.88]|uniref:RecQ-mediated genome instability protein 1 n=1 Tax=Galerina marginata (strain CBS 339.88) TaxID=685588 RepID=A0A067T6W9_GALM3|nr:hypothetical protein GALMADRAFT_137857 [Galerina marginata CBS 339.88]
MAPPEQVVNWLDKQFPKPRVDPEWLEGCTQWLEDDQGLSPVNDFPEFMERVKGQLLESDLLDSMLHGTGLDPHITRMNGNLRGPPVLVQIIAVTEIGSSAFQLEQVRAAREERLLAGVGDVEGEEDGDVEVEGEGPMPKYPRGTLRFQLSDGATILEAMEYRPIPQIILGTTPLGFKLQLKGTRIQNGMALLEPATIILLGGRQADLEAKQLDDFKRGLRARLGRPSSPQPEAQIPAVVAVRSPLRDISPPPMPSFPQHNDDVDMEPRRRLPATSYLHNVPEPSGSKEARNDRPVIGLPSRHTRTSTGGASDKNEEAEGNGRATFAERATLTFAGSQKKGTSSYFNGNAAASGSGSSRRPKDDINTAVENLDFNFEPTGGQMRRTFLHSSPAGSPTQADPFDFDFLDEVGQENKRPPPQAAINKGKGRADVSMGGSSLQPPHRIGDDASSDYGMDDDKDFANPNFLEDLDKLEKAALQTAHPPSSGSGSGSVSGSHGSSLLSSSSVALTDKNSVIVKSRPPAVMPPSTHAPRSTVHHDEIIEIDDSDDDMILEADDKENEPVATRHVRRRTEDDGNEAGVSSRSSTFASQIRSKPPMLSQKTGRPIVLATNADDIIDLSDSD